MSRSLAIAPFNVLLEGVFLIRLRPDVNPFISGA